MDMTRESKLKSVFATLLLNKIDSKVTELKVSELSLKHMFNEKEPIVGDNKGIFTHLKTFNCDNYCSSTYMIFSSIYYHRRVQRGGSGVLTPPFSWTPPPFHL